MELFDSHAHYNDERFDGNREEILEKAYTEGVTSILNAGYGLESSKKAIQIAEKYPFMYASVGISPNDLEDIKVKGISILNEISHLAKHQKVVAIGEIGLDYYWNKSHSELQKEIFIKQIKIANEVDLPIIIHTREAVSDTIDILRNKIQCENKGVFHCCPLNRELVKEALKLDYYISFAGPVTFKNVKNADDIIGMVPLEKMLVETDSPYLSPEPFRGKRNDSRNVKYVAEKIAKVRGISIEEIADITYKNAEKIFRINN